MQENSFIPREIIAISFIVTQKEIKSKLQHGIETTVAELDALSIRERKCFLKRYIEFYEALPLYHTLDNGKLIIAHAGIRENLLQSTNRKRFAPLYYMVI